MTLCKTYSKLCKEFFKEHFNIKLVLNSFKFKNYFPHKDPTLDYLKSLLAYKFTCVSCSSSYIEETSHFTTRIEEHIKKTKKTHILKQLHCTATSLYNSISFKVIDNAGSKFPFKIKKALHINWKKSTLHNSKIV